MVASASASVVARACGESAAMLHACGVADACAPCCVIFAWQVVELPQCSGIKALLVACVCVVGAHLDVSRITAPLPCKMASVLNCSVVVRAVFSYPLLTTLKGPVGASVDSIDLLTLAPQRLQC